MLRYVKRGSAYMYIYIYLFIRLEYRRFTKICFSHENNFVLLLYKLVQHCALTQSYTVTDMHGADNDVKLLCSYVRMLR